MIKLRVIVLAPVPGKSQLVYPMGANYLHFSANFKKPIDFEVLFYDDDIGLMAVAKHIVNSPRIKV